MGSISCDYNKQFKEFLMFLINDKAHYQFMLRSSNMIERQRRRFSASYKKRNNHDRQKQKQQSKCKFQPFHSEEIKQKRYLNYKITDSSSKKSIKEERKGYRNASLLSNKFLSQSETPKEKNNQFAFIMEGIKDALKLSDRKEKDMRKLQGRTKIQQFMCFKSKLHHQAYRSQLKEDAFISKGVDPSLYQMKRFLRNQTAQIKKYVLNPTLVSNTVICSSAVLYDQLSVSKQDDLNIESAQFKRSYISRRKSTATQPAQRKKIAFQIVASEGDYSYYKKIKNYLEFIFKVNFSNKMYTNINLNHEEGAPHQRYKVFIGRGNNSLLVKSIIKRRFWWEVVYNSDDSETNLFWTQNKLDKVFTSQKQSASRKQTSLTKIKKIMRVSQQQLGLNKKILNQQQISLVQNYINNDGFTQPYQQIFIPDVLTNHLPNNNSIGSKKNLFKSLFNYYSNIASKNPFDYVPKTYHIISKDCEEFKAFLSENAQDPNRIWIIKPGENTNRGKAIQLSPFSKIQQCLTRQKHENGDAFTYIIQSYINKPFLYNNRKFDIRHYILLTSINGIFKGYWYKQGYIRTSSQPFQLQNLNNKYIHLTNDAIQKYSQNYQKYQPANKLSYNEFQRYLDYNYHSKGHNFQKDILSKMKQMSIDIIKANYLILDSKRCKNNFEIFGLDFMIDKDFKPWLIQANYNPCLEVNCPVLERVIPGMLQNTFRIAIDPLFPPPTHFPSGKRFYLSDNYLKNLKYQLIFDQQTIKSPIKNTYGYEDDELQNEQFQDEGCQITNIDI